MVRWDLCSTTIESVDISDDVYVECNSCRKISILKYKSMKYRKKEYNCQSCRSRKKWQDGDYRNMMEKAAHNSRGKHLAGIKRAFENKEYRNKISNNQKRLWENEEYRKRQSEKLKLQWEDEKYRKNMIELRNSEEFNAKLRTDDHRNKMRRISKEIWSDPKFAKKMSKVKVEMWKNDEYRSKMTKVVDEDWLYGKYVKMGMSIRQISLECGHSRRVLSHFVDRYGFNKHDIKISKEEFIKRALVVHGDKYSYHEVVYVSYGDPVTIICKKHGGFLQTPTSHTHAKRGCPKCAGTRLQQEIFGFVSCLVNAKFNDRVAIKPYELDIYIESKMLAIEVNGIYWHSYDRLECKKEKNAHVNKLDRCADNNISLIQIMENEWLDKRPIVESIIKRRVKRIDRVDAKACNVVEINVDSYKEFANSNCLAGYKYSDIACGLEYNGELVSIMSFSKRHEHRWEIIRQTDKIDIDVVGSIDKMLKWFISHMAPNEIFHCADRRYHSGRQYEDAGFVLDSIIKPDYCYVKGSNVLSKFRFQKCKLKNKLDIFDPKLTEAENMFNNGYRRLWDAGRLWMYLDVSVENLNADESLTPRIK